MPDISDVRENIRILAIDDSPLVLDALKLLFGEGELRGATTTAQALSLLEGDPSLRVVIVDLAMPGGGVPFLRTLRARFPDRAIIVLSGDAAALAAVAPEIGVFRCLEKGEATIDVLEATVAEARARLGAP